MSADKLIQYLSWAIYILIFVNVLLKAVRRPLRTNIDTALLFSLPALLVVLAIPAEIDSAMGYTPASIPALTIFTSALLVALPYMLLRLADDFSDVPAWIMRLAEAGLAAIIIGVAVFVLSPPQPIWFSLLASLYLIGFFVYATIIFFQQSRLSSGVTRRRMWAAAGGSLCLGAIFVITVAQIALPQWNGLWTPLADIAGLGSGISYFFGFAPPEVLRRAWQEPELRAFLARAASLPRLPDTQSILREMEQGAANSLGAPNARIGLWDEQAQVLRFTLENQDLEVVPDPSLTTGMAFLTQKPVFNPNILHSNPLSADVARARGAKAIMAAPITAGDKKLGALAVYAPHSPVFVDQDLELVQLLADQAAVILESRALIDEAVRVQAREEATRLKEDFLSAAAHDLKTPLTTLVAQAQLIERRAKRMPDAPVDLMSIQRLMRETQRLKNLVLELLDAARSEQGKLVGEVAEVDLVEVANEVCARYNSELHPCVVETDDTVVGTYDTMRVFQLIENLVENAVKYSPEAGEVRVKVWQEDGWNYIDVADHGIGIPRDELPRIFERFHRGRNVDDRRFAGMGLGLYICQGIAEQHGGRIWAESQSNKGSTFHVALPAPTTPSITPITTPLTTARIIEEGVASHGA